MRFGIVGWLDLLLPGSGHLYARRTARGLVFLLPIGLAVGATVGLYFAKGATGILALVVTPGVLPMLAIANVALALWRLVAMVDGVRIEPRTRPAAIALGVGVVVLLVVPHLLAGRLIASTDAFLNSMFASGPDTPEPGPSDEPEIAPPEFGGPYVAFLRPDNGIDDQGIALPTPAPTPKPPPGPYKGGGGAASLPPLGASVPWNAPGAIPWGNDGRFDLLLLGSDAGGNRWSRRMDVMLLVEIDVATGKVAMIGLPRNIQNAPFPPGFAHDAVSCGCMKGLLNEMYVEATARHPDRWEGSGAVKGIGAVRGVISELTGRPIDAVLVADLMGVVQVVDAMGGIDINVPSSVYDDKYPDPVRGDIVLRIKAGQQHMDGRTALAYARSRHQDSDYGRMARQQTLLLAIRSQIGAATIIQAPDLFAAAKGRTWTDLPRSSLPALVELFGKAANASVKQLRIVPSKYPAWLTATEIAKIRHDVGSILGPLPSPTPTPTETPTASPTETPGPTSSPTGSVDPSPSDGASPTPSGEASPSPATSPSPSPAQSPDPSPSPSSSQSQSPDPSPSPSPPPSPSSSPSAS